MEIAIAKIALSTDRTRLGFRQHGHQHEWQRNRLGALPCCRTHKHTIPNHTLLHCTVLCSTIASHTQFYSTLLDPAIP